MNLETKITIYKFTPQLFTLTQKGYDLSEIGGTLSGFGDPAFISL